MCVAVCGCGGARGCVCYCVLVLQVMDLVEYPPLFGLSLDPPILDSATPPTLGSLTTCLSTILALLNKVHTVYIQYALTIYTSQVDPGSPSKTVLSGRSLSQCVVSGSRSRLVLLLEVGVFLTLSQSTRYLVDPSLDHRDKQQLKKELASELVSVLQGLINRVLELCSVTRVLVVQIQ